MASQLQAKIGAGKKVSDAELERHVTRNNKAINQPYSDKTPTSIQSTPEVTIDQLSLDTAREHIEDATFRKDFVESKDTFKNRLMEIYENFGNTRQTAVDGGVGGKTYNVTIDENTYKNIIKNIEAKSALQDKNDVEIARDLKISTEKLIVLNNADALLKNSVFVESGNVTSKSGRKRRTVKHDYFEAPITIAGEKYVIRFDVTVKRATGENVVSGIDIVKAKQRLNACQ